MKKASLKRMDDMRHEPVPKLVFWDEETGWSVDE